MRDRGIIQNILVKKRSDENNNRRNGISICNVFKSQSYFTFSPFFFKWKQLIICDIISLFYFVFPKQRDHFITTIIDLSRWIENPLQFQRISGMHVWIVLGLATSSRLDIGHIMLKSTFWKWSDHPFYFGKIGNPLKVPLRPSCLGWSTTPLEVINKVGLSTTLVLIFLIYLFIPCRKIMAVFCKWFAMLE
jgi:hypothetical protein